MEKLSGRYRKIVVMKSDYYFKTWPVDGGKYYCAGIYQDWRVFGIKVFTNTLRPSLVKSLPSTYDSRCGEPPERPLGMIGYTAPFGSGALIYQLFKNEELAVRAALRAIEDLKDYQPIKVNTYR